MDCLQWESVVALGLLLTSVFVSIIIILILPDYHQIDGRKEMCVHLEDSITCGKTEVKLQEYLNGVSLNPTACLYTNLTISINGTTVKCLEVDYNRTW